MTHAAIVASYSDTALAGVINQLSKSGLWQIRLQAALIEQRRRAKISNRNQHRTPWKNHSQAK